MIPLELENLPGILDSSPPDLKIRPEQATRAAGFNPLGLENPDLVPSSPWNSKIRPVEHPRSTPGTGKSPSVAQPSGFLASVSKQ